MNIIQFDGISFIEHLSFDAFNEGTRLVKSIRYGRSLFGTKKEHYGLKRIRAMIELNEIIWIFFRVHTANAVRIAKRLTVSRVERMAS